MCVVQRFPPQKLTGVAGDTSGQVSFVSGPKFPVAAGIGNFNASWVKDSGPYSTFLFQSDFNRFLGDFKRAWAVDSVVPGTSICRSDEPLKNTATCKASYFLPGGLELITPWPTKNKDFRDKPVYSVFNVQGLQLDFSFAEIGEDPSFNAPNDCIVTGGDDAAVQICVTKSSTNTIYASESHSPCYFRVKAHRC